MKKDGLENLIHTRHIVGERYRGKQQATCVNGWFGRDSD